MKRFYLVVCVSMLTKLIYSQAAAPTSYCASNKSTLY
jgi:hypothetical protein